MDSDFLYGLIPVLYMIGMVIFIGRLRKRAAAEVKQKVEQRAAEMARAGKGQQRPRPDAMDAALARIERKLQKQKEKRTVNVKETPQREKQSAAPQAPPAHRPHHPMEYDSVHVPHSTELQRHAEQLDMAAAQVDQKQEVTQKQHIQQAAARAQHRMQAAEPAFTMTQAIIWSEILGKPKALQRRRRF